MIKRILFIVVGVVALACNSTTSDRKTLEPDIVDTTSEKEGVVASRNDCAGQNETSDLGIGLAMWNFNCDNETVFFADSTLTIPEFSVDLCSFTELVCPLFYKPDYGIMHFVVLENTDSYMSVLHNGGTSLFIETGGDFSFVPWNELLVKHSTGVRSKSGGEVFTVVEAEGEYIHVVSDSGEKSELRWRSDEELLVEIFFLI